MASEGQRRRRRRARQRRRNRNRGSIGRGNLTAGYGTTAVGRRLNAGEQGQVYNPGAWYTETYEFAIMGLSGSQTSNVYCTSLEDVTGLRDRLAKAGEFRLLRLVCRYSPIAANDKDRIAIAPYFDPSNKFNTAAEFVTNGRRVRKADQNFQVSWDTPSEPSVVTMDVGPPVVYHGIIGGVCVYYHAGKSTDFGIIACHVTYQFRGRKTEAASVTAT
uniref:Uncharacterized protein n=1 Tax=Apple barna-like virus 1 TaxID=2709742 RepID=A0A6C0X1S9_9VIRU|nr:MAG: hypothetical protein [Apple barna-like virus 1]